MKIEKKKKKEIKNEMLDRSMDPKTENNKSHHHTWKWNHHGIWNKKMSGFSSVVATVVLLAVATGMVVSLNNKEGKTGEVYVFIFYF